MQRRHHYERAFEEYLRRRRIPYVAVDEARKALLPVAAASSHCPDDPALKSFDFVTYGQNTNLLIDVKGRRVGPSASRRAARTSDFLLGRLESWVTETDVSSLLAWQRLFGAGFEAVFVFIYWCQGGIQPPDGLFQEVMEHRNEWYALRVVSVDDYARAMKPRSPRWRTVDLPTAAFERLSQPFAPIPPYSGVSTFDLGPTDPALQPLGAPLG